MLILALESSAKAASAALYEGESLLGLSLMHCGLTHSETLLPMAEELLRRSGKSMAEVGLVAVARGPGSFTGIRIGVATAKGLCWGGDKPCCGVSTLEAMAWQGAHLEGRLLCCVMDARRSQVYNGLFRAEGGRPVRLREDRALSLDELLPELDESPVLLGDGALLTAGEIHPGAGTCPHPERLGRRPCRRPCAGERLGGAGPGLSSSESGGAGEIGKTEAFRRGSRTGIKEIEKWELCMY